MKKSGDIRFEAILLRPATPKAATWAFLRLPGEASARLPSRSQVSVTGTFAGQSFEATLEPDGKGGHWLKVPARLQTSAGVTVGDTVSLAMTPASVEPEPKVPPDLRRALSANEAAKTTWMSITARARRDWIHWVVSGKKAETRVKRIASACDMLAKGKRRVCCFDSSGRFSRGAIGAPEAASS